MNGLILLAALLSSPVPQANARADRLAESLLAIHNRERAQVGVPPLVWDEGWPREAASYIPELIDLGDLEHSPEAEEGETGENLAMGTDGHYSPEDLTQLWVDERTYLRAGRVSPSQPYRRLERSRPLYGDGLARHDQRRLRGRLGRRRPLSGLPLRRPQAT